MKRINFGKKNNYKFIVAPKGSLVIFLGQLWHQVGKILITIGDGQF